MLFGLGWQIAGFSVCLLDVLVGGLLWIGLLFCLLWFVDLVWLRDLVFVGAVICSVFKLRLAVVD